MHNFADSRLRRVPYPVVAILFAAAHIGSARLGLLFAIRSPHVSAVWPASGLDLAVLLILGVRYWPVILVGSFLADAMVGTPWLASAGLASANAIESLAGVWIFQCASKIRKHLEYFEEPVATLTAALA